MKCRKLQPYQTRMNCPKCRMDWTPQIRQPTYCDGPSCNILGTEYKTTYQDNKPWSTEHILPPEHLHVTCPGCNYVEVMECADAEEDSSVTIHEADCPHRTKCVGQVFKEFSRQLRGY